MYRYNLPKIHNGGAKLSRQEVIDVINGVDNPVSLFNKERNCIAECDNNHAPYAVAGITSRMPDGVYAVVVLSGVLCIRLA